MPQTSLSETRKASQHVTVPTRTRKRTLGPGSADGQQPEACCASPSCRYIALGSFAILQAAAHQDVCLSLAGLVVNDDFFVLLDAFCHGWIRRHVALSSLLKDMRSISCFADISLSIAVKLALRVLLGRLMDVDLHGLTFPQLLLMLLRNLLLNRVQCHETPNVNLLLLARATHASNSLHLEGHSLLLRLCLHRMNDEHVVGSCEVSPAG
mmetsp:Transcript_48520/g.115523  ORF Transcript_48520/g.115523 Transcript_48520/m.115523 type:complete len:210 (-) Transcript_48520:3492-4121(-)